MRVRTLQPPKIKRIRARLGWAWQVTATVAGKRRKYQVYESTGAAGSAEAKAREEAARWCAEQAGRKLEKHRVETKLTADQVVVAERFFGLLPNDVTCERIEQLAKVRLSNDQLIMAELLFRRMPNLQEAELSTKIEKWEAELKLRQIPLREAVTKFMESRRVQIGQRRTYEGLLRAFVESLGESTPIASIDEGQCKTFLARFENPTTFNKRRGDLGSFFNWLCWQEMMLKSPLAKIEERDERKKDLPPETLGHEQAAALMCDVETNYSGLATYFALALFGGCRPSWRIGEAFELIYAEPARRSSIFREGELQIPGDISKTGLARVVPYAEVPPLDAWLAAYPPGQLPLPKNPERIIQTLRQKYQIPHDGLRHTAISAAVSLGMDVSRAVLIFGVEEGIMKHRYAKLLRREEAEALRTIMPIAKSNGNKQARGELPLIDDERVNEGAIAKSGRK